MKFWRLLETAQNRKNAWSAIGVLDFDLPETAKWPPEGPLLILKGPEKKNGQKSTSTKKVKFLSAKSRYQTSWKKPSKNEAKKDEKKKTG